MIYRNGQNGNYYMKRCHITGLTREKDYNLTKGEKGSRIEWLTANPNGEAETVRVSLADDANGQGRPPRNKELTIDFASLAIKGKDSLGNLVTKYKVKSVTMERKGTSTLGGREVWFDPDVLRLNYDGRGRSLGVFQGDDKVLVITRNGEFFTSSYSDSNHYEDNILRIEKLDPDKIWTLLLFDKGLGYPYLKRFRFEVSARPQRFVGGDEGGDIILLTDKRHPLINVSFSGADATRPPMQVDAVEFIAEKSFKAKGKRLTTFLLGDVALEETVEEDTALEEITEETAQEANGETDSGSGVFPEGHADADGPDSPISSDSPEQPAAPSLFDFEEDA